MTLKEKFEKSMVNLFPGMDLMKHKSGAYHSHTVHRMYMMFLEGWKTGKTDDWSDHANN